MRNFDTFWTSKVFEEIKKYAIPCINIKFQFTCHLSENPRDFPNASAIVFHNANFNQRQSLPGVRNPNVPYVLFSLESPTNDQFRPPSGISHFKDFD